jgi:lysozyme family protein
MDIQSLPANFLFVCRYMIDQIEKGYSNVASDRGGETKYGISKKTYPHLDIANLTYDAAIWLYWNDFWCAARCDKLPIRMATFVFDGAVQHRRLPNGGFIGAQFLQQALGVTADGVIGPQTLQRAWASKNNVEVLPSAFSLRTLFYDDIVSADSTQRANQKGWRKRMFLLAIFIGGFVPEPEEVRR